MSDTGEDLDRLAEAKATWLKTHVDYEVRSQRIGKSVDKATGLTKDGLPATEEQRKLLRDRLRELRVSAQQFSSLALEDDYKALSRLIEEVTSHLDHRALTEAESALQRAEQRIADGRRRLERLLDLRATCDRLPGRIGRMSTEHDIETIAPLVDRVGEVRRQLWPPTLNPEAAALALEQLQDDIEQTRLRLETSRGEVATMQMQRKFLVEDLVALRLRATDAEADPVAVGGKLDELIKRLETLATERDETALRHALDEAGQSHDTLEQLVEAAEEDRDLRMRQALLPGLAERLKQLKQDIAPDRAKSNELHVQELVRLEKAAAEAIDDEDSADVTGIQAMLDGLEEHHKYMRAENKRIEGDQFMCRQALTAYKGYLNTAPTSKFWADLKNAHKALPPAVSAGKDPAFLTAAAWAYESLGGYAAIEEFIRLWLVVDSSETGLEEREAYKTAKERHQQLTEQLDELEKHAGNEDLLVVRTALNATDPWLKVKTIYRLDTTQQEAVSEFLDKAEKALKKLQTAKDEAKDKAQIKDGLDGGHSIQRHGPDVSKDDLKKRLSKGIAPGGTFSPTRKSSRFINYTEWESTREAAFLRAETLLGVSFGPNRDQNGGGGPITFTLSHGRTIGEGFEGVGAGTYKANPKGGGGGQVFSTFVELPNLTDNKSTIEWNGKKWVLAQHFPTN